MDHVGSVNNAATIISTLHRCEKQLRKAAAAHAGTPQESAAPASPFLAPCATFWSGKIRQYRLTHRAQRVLAETREEHGLTAHPRHRHLPQQHGHPVATWAGTTPPRRWQPHSRGQPMKSSGSTTSPFASAPISAPIWRPGTSDASDQLSLPEVEEPTLAGLMFNEALPDRLAIATLSARLDDRVGPCAARRGPCRPRPGGRSAGREHLAGGEIDALHTAVPRRPACRTGASPRSHHVRNSRSSKATATRSFGTG